MLGETISHYRILEKLGQGGMGEVYLAEDTRLDRKVALKFLAPELARDVECLVRFRNEAKAAAELSHPNIATIHDIGEADGQPFIVLEYLAGQTLKDRITQGPLTVEETLSIGKAMAAGLAEAHAHGIVHRDIKSANVMLTEKGEVKILDFGLAHRGDATQLTRQGTTLGTIHYMSPEQARGESADARSDIWSLGVVLYECLTGRLPFTGTGPATLEQIASTAPSPPTALRTGIPLELEQTILRCMEKSAQLRYQHADDLFAKLSAVELHIGSPRSDSTSGPQSLGPESAPRKPSWGVLSLTILVLAVIGTAWLLKDSSLREVPASKTAPSTSVPSDSLRDRNSLAVMPFVNMSDDEEQEYFSDGISEELLNLLTKVPRLRVTSRTSAFSMKGHNLTAKEIAQKLNVAYIVEGSVRKSGEQLRITARLIDTNSDTRVWSRTYDRKLDDIFAIQDEIAADVVRELDISLMGEAPKTQRTDTEAYLLWLRARQVTQYSPPAQLWEAEELVRRALEIDPEYAMGWCELARVQLWQTVMAMRPFEDGYRLTQHTAARALELDPDLAEAHAVLAQSLVQFDLPAAARHSARALRLDPGNPLVLQLAARMARRLGRYEEGIRLYKQLLLRDPLNQSAYSGIGYAYFALKQWDSAIESQEKALALSPNGAGVSYDLGASLLSKGEPDAALPFFEQETHETFRLIGLALVYHDLGRTDDADAVFAELIDHHAQRWAYNIAYVAAYRGESDRAFLWLDKAAASKDSGLPSILENPFFSNIHDDPRWVPFLRSIGHAPEQLADIEFEAALPY